MMGSSDMTRFGSLEFPTLPPIGMWVPPIFEPSYTFLFESQDFIANWLDVLCLREEALVPTPSKEERPLSALRHPVTSTTRHLRFTLSVC